MDDIGISTKSRMEKLHNETFNNITLDSGKNIWINNLLLFKIKKKYSIQYLCICDIQYKNELNMQVGDIIFIKDPEKSKLYGRLGEIKALNRNKVIVSIMNDIGTSTKSEIEELHNELLNDRKFI